jgi:hypothetical protein
MILSKMKFIATSGAIGIMAMLCAPAAQATICALYAPCGPTPVPEPATLGLLALGVAGIAAMKRRK